ncbi:MAG: glycine oxidase ThiO [Agitococcus sp.]|nr:glycine oxidase ThiO [Agitococcus sp.]
MKVVIVGGGVIGLLSALVLAQAGCQVTILEKNAGAIESSWAGGGIVSPMYPWRYPPAVTALAQLAQAEYPLLAQQLFAMTGINIELNACGMLMLEAEDQRDALVWGQQYQQQLLPLSAKDISQLSPLLANFKTGIWVPHIANVRNPLLLSALMQAVTQLGVCYRNHTNIVSWHKINNRIAAIESSTGEKYTADAFVITAGAWTGQILNLLAINMPVNPMKGQMILYKLPEQKLKQIVLHQGHYLIPRQDGHLLCGSTLENTGFEKQTTDEALALLQKTANRIMPLLSQYQPIKQWAGLRPASPNGIPYIGRVPQFSNLWVNAGHFRNGLVLAPASAKLLADLMLCRTPCVNPEPYQII